MTAYEIQPDGTLREVVDPPMRVDLVQVVRCRDCEHFAVDQSDHEYRSGWWCKRWDTDMVEPDGYCAWGERGRRANEHHRRADLESK